MNQLIKIYLGSYHRLRPFLKPLSQGWRTPADIKAGSALRFLSVSHCVFQYDFYIF